MRQITDPAAGQDDAEEHIQILATSAGPSRAQIGSKPPRSVTAPRRIAKLAPVPKTPAV